MAAPGFYSTDRAAQLLGVNTRTLRGWIEKGWVPGAEKTPSGRFLIRRKPFDAYVEQGRKEAEQLLEEQAS